MNKKILLIIISVLVVFASVFSIYTYLIKQPSNDRTWLAGQDIPVRIERTQNPNQLLINNIRDFRFQAGKPISVNYQNRDYDLNQIENVWFLVEPFGGWSGVAHTFFIFDFKNQDPIALSVESRREVGEDYSAFMGLFNNYEVMYIWSTEKDILNRMVSERSDVYMYRLHITKDSSKKLFEQLIEETEALEKKPAFYNTLTSNCTNLLAKAANKIKEDAIPWHFSYILPGFSAPYLYSLGYIETYNWELKDLQRESLISNYVKDHIDDEDKAFSLGLRIRKFGTVPDDIK
jgi:hypothetical protein